MNGTNITEARIVQISQNNKELVTMCVTGNLETVLKKITDWHRKDVPLEGYLTWYGDFNTCYVSNHIALPSEYGTEDKISIGVNSFLVLGYCAYENEHRLIFKQ